MAAIIAEGGANPHCDSTAWGPRPLPRPGVRILTIRNLRRPLDPPRETWTRHPSGATLSLTGLPLFWVPVTRRIGPNMRGRRTASISPGGGAITALRKGVSTTRKRMAGPTGTHAPTLTRLAPGGGTPSTFVFAPRWDTLSRTTRRLCRFRPSTHSRARVRCSVAPAKEGATRAGTAPQTRLVFRR